ncbi:hypothetical protein GIB67_006053 [Kingdonia uniflora]|uniref:PC-Esterase n=1 Tax=Kingdonia uniflora TaxID=39325 RepID=A0A7J7LPG4_9MAGN|nr:hypothetical protein GIB67_006053 [Kingdonia uniflora]
MFGAVQFGIFAAFIVLFVPMGLAGWHLSRNKMLFFSGALFITLAVGVHLTPYFPSITDFVSSLSVTSVVSNRNSCISFLHEIVWDVRDSNKVLWGWERSTPVVACEFQKLSRVEASVLLNGSWIVVVGDSQARLVVLSLLNLVMDGEEMGSIRGDLFKRHSDYKIVIEKIGVKLEFLWAPYAYNVTELLTEFKKNRRYPDVLVMGSGLWHMLHVTNSSEYGDSLGNVRKSVVSLLSTEFGNDGPVTGSVSVQSPHLFWLGMPTLINSMLNTEDKRKKMNGVMQDAYDRELYQSKLLRQSGGPLLLLDIKSLSGRCGVMCTVDGMHYDEHVYEAAVHIMLNALLIDSQQRL